MKSPDTEPSAAFAKLFPELGDDRLLEAQENLDRYLSLALRIYERILLDAEAYAQMRTLTAPKDRSTILNKEPLPS